MIGERWWEPVSRASGVPFDGRAGLGWTSLSHSMHYYGPVVAMRPSAFLRLAAPLARPREGVVAHIREILRGGEAIAQPFLTLDEGEDGIRVSGHEGRHRMLAILDAFGDVEVPVLLSFRGRKARDLPASTVHSLRAGIVPEMGGATMADAFGAARLNGETSPSPADTLAESAAHYYEACELYEDEDLDPGDALAVLRRAFGASDCDAFADVLGRLTGWPIARMAWTSGGELCHHTVARRPDGALVDVRGETDESALRRLYRAPKAAFSSDAGSLYFPSGETLEDGRDAEAVRIAGTIRAFRHGIFGTSAFRKLTCREIEGVDFAETPGPMIR